MNEIAATTKIIDDGGVIGAILILALVQLWWFIRKMQETAENHAKQIEVINASYTDNLAKNNEAHDLQIERLNNSNLANIEKIMSAHADERSEWYKTSREFTTAINGLSLAIEKRKSTIEFHNEPIPS